MSVLATKYGILVGVDGSAESDAAIRFATREAMMRDAPITLMHVVAPIPNWPMPSRQAEISEAWEENAREVIEQARKTALATVSESASPDVRTEVVYSTDVHVQRRLVCDKPAHWLIEESQHAQLVVVGSHGRGGFPGMQLGSVSSALAQSAKAPLIIVRPSER
jgi:nucleotide-binding universal stress UspA family protein